MGNNIQEPGSDLIVSPPSQNINIRADLNEQLTYTGNLGVEIVATTRDKISNALHVSLPKYDRKRAWVGPTSIFVTLLITALTADFKDFDFVSGQTLFGACVMATIFCGFFTGRALLQLIGSHGHAEIVDAIVSTASEPSKQK